MTIALKLANKAENFGEVPVGALIVKEREIIATGFNKKETKKNALYHAEIECINKASNALGTWRLLDCDIYVTLEPCLMCMGALINSRIRKIIFGAQDILNGACFSNKTNLKYSYIPQITGGILSQKCSKTLKDFFRKLRLNR